MNDVVTALWELMVGLNKSGMVGDADMRIELERDIFTDEYYPSLIAALGCCPSISWIIEIGKMIRSINKKYSLDLDAHIEYDSDIARICIVINPRREDKDDERVD